MSAPWRTRGSALVAAVAGLGLVASPLALTTGATADESKNASASVAKKAKATKKKGRVKLHLLAINDFHGQVEKVDPAASSSGRVDGVPAGGAEYLATHLKRLRQNSRASGAKPITVAAGDLVGATPLFSAAFHDEPTIEAMNLMGLRVSSVGNHEFDEGYKELKRLQRGGCLDDGDGANNQNSCPDAGHPFEGAEFQYLAANVIKESTDRSILPSYSIKKVQGKKVGFIGMTLKDTPNIVTKEGIEGLRFTREVQTANRLVPKLRKRGAEAIVVLLHEGGAPGDQANVSGCADVEGPGIEIAKQLRHEIDVVISGHTHQPYICKVRDPQGKKRLITSAFSVGRVVTKIRLQLDRKSGEVLRGKTTAVNRVVTNTGVDPSAALTRLINRYRPLVDPIANQVLGKVAPEGSRNTLAREFDGTDFELGNLIADSQKLDESAVNPAGDEPVIAFMNPGGIRTDLVENDDNDVTYGAAFAVQPFNNYVVSMDLTGQQILDVLEQQWNDTNENTDPGEWNVLQVSGLEYTYDVSDAAGTGDAVVGTPQVDTDRDGEADADLNAGTTYRVVVNSFLAGGGDGFPTLGQGGDVYFGGLDIDALAAQFERSGGVYTPPATGRIVAQP